MKKNFWTKLIISLLVAIVVCVIWIASIYYEHGGIPKQKLIIAIAGSALAGWWLVFGTLWLIKKFFAFANR